MRVKSPAFPALSGNLLVWLQKAHLQRNSKTEENNYQVQRTVIEFPGDLAGYLEFFLAQNVEAIMFNWLCTEKNKMHLKNFHVRPTTYSRVSYKS